MKNKQILQNAVDKLHGAVQPSTAAALVLAVAAWVRCSQKGLLKGSYAFSAENYPRDGKALEKVFSAIVKDAVLGNNSSAFNLGFSNLQQLSLSQLAALLEIVEQFDWQEWQQNSALANDLAEYAELGMHSLPQEVTALMAELAAIHPKNAVYIPFESTYQLSSAVAARGGNPFAETQMFSPISGLLNLLTNAQIELHQGNCLTQPGYLIDKHLRQFETSISFPPFGVKYPTSLGEQDVHGRFPEKTTSGTVLAIRHILAQTRGRAIIAVPNNLLFTSGAERALREDLLQKQMIEAVITLPTALLNFTNIGFSLLVLNTLTPQPEIIFVNGEDEACFARDGRGKTTLTQWKEIADAVLQRSSELIPVAVVSANDVLENDAQLQVSRYFDNQSAELSRVLSMHKLAPLNELVDFVRPALISQSEGEACIEFSPADFPKYGYVLSGSRKVQVPDSAKAKVKKSFLKPYDVLVTIKGSAGKVGIVSPEIAASNQRFVASQTSIVLRTNEGGVDPLYLYSYLKSCLGQEQLQSIVSGATIPLIQLKELARLAIPLPPMQSQQKAKALFEQVVALEQSVQRIRGEQECLEQSFPSVLQ